MQLTPEQLKENWDKLIGYINTYISEPRRQKLLNFYKLYEERIIIMPASSKISYHNAFIGGYVEHVLRVIEASLSIAATWEIMGNVKNYTEEELVFSALNHDLGKMGTKEQEYYIPNPSSWHVENKGEVYTYNTKVGYMQIPDRSLYLLTQHGINYTDNEFMAIKLHDGMYEEANKAYLTTYIPEAKPRTSLVYIIHQADQLAARIEFEREWFPKIYGEPKTKVKKTGNFKQDKINKEFKAMGTSPELSKSISNILEII